MKKSLSILLCLVMVFAIVGCAKSTSNTSSASTAAASTASTASTSSSAAATSSSSMKYTGTAQGLGGDVTVTLTIKDGKIVDATAEGLKETPGIGSKAIESMPPQMAANNTINVDMVSGATVTSTAVINAAKAALVAAGLNPADFQKAVAVAKASDEVKDCDVVIIGAGGAGMMAAITANDAGKKVIVVESQSAVGGNSVRSTGGMNAAKTVYQDSNKFGESAGVEKTLASAAKYTGAGEATIKALAATVQKQWNAYKANPVGYFDSVELFELDTLIGGKGLNDPKLVATLAENSAEAIDELDKLGAVLHNVGSFGGASVKRIHRPVNAKGQTVSVGAYVVPILEQNLTSRGIELLLNTTATRILTNANGAAVGIVATGKTGNTITINAKAVVVATGGFGANNDMIKALNPILDGYITTNASGAQGQGIKMAQAVGAGTVDMDQIQLHPTVHVAADGSANLITEGLRGDGAILVNKEGKRFYDEVSTRDKVSDAENNQTDGMAWLIVDQKMMDASAVIQGYNKKGWMVSGVTAEDLAKAMGVDPTTLANTIATWNTYVQNKKDPDFDRTSFAKILEGPFYACTVQPGVHHTMGGLTIDPKCEVLTGVNGIVIPGLFAAGEVTGGIHGANRLGGNAVADFVVFGRIAGQSAAEYAK